MSDKVFHTFNEFEKEFLPNNYAKRIREERIAEVGLGMVLAEELFEEIEKELNKK